MTARRFRAACEYAFRYVQERIVPNPATRYKPGGSTGNMAFNAFKIRFEQRGSTLRCVAWIDRDIAPYVVYTDKPWISPRWGGKKNPNEGWWKRAVQDFRDKIAEYLGGRVA